MALRIFPMSIMTIKESRNSLFQLIRSFGRLDRCLPKSPSAFEWEVIGLGRVAVTPACSQGRASFGQLN
jgi:hypothetical protein